MQSIEEACQNYQNPLKEEEIFKRFISDNLEELQNTTTTVETVCGAKLFSGELTFQCFTCSPDPNHIYCYQCFDVSLHKNHKCIIKHTSTGCCDCGDTQVIKQEGFCSRHKGFQNIDSQAELTKISIELQNSIRNFVKSVSTIYLKLMKQIKSEYQLYDNLIIQYYHLSEKWKIETIRDIIDKEINIESYYRNFQKALYLHNMLFRTIIWLTKSRLSYIFLITKILAEKLTPESHQSIIEDLFEYQVIVETQGPYESLKLESIIFSFHADQNFKNFLKQVYLRKYKYFWLVTYHKECYQEKVVTDYLNKLKSIGVRKIDKQFVNELVQTYKNLSEYIEETRDLTPELARLQLSEIHDQHFQYVSEDFQIDFLNDLQLSNVFEMNAEIQNVLHSNKSEGSSNYTCLPNIFWFRFEYVFFDSIVYTKLKNSLGVYYEQFIKTQAQSQLLNKLQVQDFFLSAYIQSFSKVQPITLDVDEEAYSQIREQTVFDVASYLNQQGFSIKTILNGIHQIISSKQNQGFLGENLIRYLLRQCYFIIKNNRNKFTSVQQELDSAYWLYIVGTSFSPLKKMYLLLIKSGTTIDKVFVFLLCYIYNLQQNLKQYLLDLLEEDPIILQEELKKILSRCIQTFISIQFCQNKMLEEIYLGLRDQEDQSILESFDTAFLRIYQFLYGNEGYLDFLEIVFQKHLPTRAEAYKLQNALLLRLISSDIDMYNVCGHMFVVLPNDLKLSFAKILQNFYNLSLYLDYTDIEAKLINMGIQISKNTSNHILQICLLDQAVKKLKLKPEFRPIFDPAIFHVSNNLNNQIVEKLVDTKKQEGFIFLGDGIKWDLEQFSTDKYRVTLQHLLKYYSEKYYIFENLYNLFLYGHFSVQIYQLLYIQFIASNYFRKAEFQESAPLYIEKLKKIYPVIQRKDDIQKLKALILEIEQMTLEVQPIAVKPSTTNTNGQNKYKEKFKTLQNAAGLQAMLDNLHLDEEISYQQCSSCKLDLCSSEAKAVILLTCKPQSTNFPLPQLDVDNQLRCIGLTNCRHFFHNQCLVDQFEINSRNVDDHLPRWVKLGCPVCKQASNFMLPLAKEITDKEVSDFNSSLLFFLLESEMDISDNKQGVPIIYELYYQLIFDLLTQLFSDTQEYKRNEKNVVFQQLIKLLLGTAKNDDNLNLIFNDVSSNKFLYLIEQFLVKKKDYELFQKEATKWVVEIKCPEEIRSLLYSSLSIPDHVKQQQQPQIANEIQFPQIQQIQEKMISILGNTFQEFYYRHFPLMCSQCGFFNKNQKMSKDVLVCLLCSKAYCQFSCMKQQCGNLNLHAKISHNGHSLYISLSTGNIIIVSFPISINRYKCLYYNKLGQKINIEDSHTEWSDFVIDEQKVKELSQIILNNSYQSIVRNLEVRQNQLDLNGTF